MRRAPPLADGYPVAVGLLLPVLGSLARNGVAVSPGDGLDYLHTFLVDHWDRLRETYRPEDAEFEAYLRRSFEWFVLREASRRRLQAGQALDPESLHAATVDVDRSADHARVREVLADAPSDIRRVLSAFFDSGSERAAAAALGYTRHRTRTALAEAVAYVAARIDRPPMVTAHDWHVTQLVVGGRTVSEAALLLGRPPAEARAVHHHTLSLLLAGLRA